MIGKNEREKGRERERKEGRKKRQDKTAMTPTKD